MPPTLPDKPAAYDPARHDTIRLQKRLSAIALQEPRQATQPVLPPQNSIAHTAQHLENEIHLAAYEEALEARRNTVPIPPVPAAVNWSTARKPVEIPPTQTEKVFFSPSDFDDILIEYKRSRAKGGSKILVNPPDLIPLDYQPQPSQPRRESYNNSYESYRPPLHVKIPSPSSRQNSFTPEIHSRPPSALYAHPQLMPQGRSPSRSPSYNCSPEIRPHYYPTSQFENGTRRSDSRSPERESAYTPSEDDYSVESPGPPSQQARRGRQGENVFESDLPAMPPLFADTDSRGLPRLPQPIAAYPPTSPARSPVRTHSKRPSFNREPDVLQSIKTLPVRPIRCPPLSWEERFHPAPFVKTPKFRIKVNPGTAIFVAGGEVYGQLEISSEEGFRAQLGSTQVLVGEIGVEIIGYEEIHNAESGHEPRSFTFLYSRRVFQRKAEIHPAQAEKEQILTSAVQYDPPPDHDGYRQPSKGSTSFPFAFPIPIDAPSSIDKGVARVRYAITGYATVKLQGSEEVIATTVPLRVVEAWDVGNPVYSEPIEATQGRDIANYNELAIIAKLNTSLFFESKTVKGVIRVANHSSRKTKDVKFFLVHKITFFGDHRGEQYECNPSDDFAIEATLTGFTEQHIIARQNEEVWTFEITIPEGSCSVRNCALFEVTPFILVKVSTGALFKSVRLYITGLSIAHPASMVDNVKARAPNVDDFKWQVASTYTFQRIRQGQVTPVEWGHLEVTPLMMYIDAHARVVLLNP